MSNSPNKGTTINKTNTGAGAGDGELHAGKWTQEEEAYVALLISEFQAGYLPIREGTSLRSFLSKMLNCKPKRISKKFEGSSYNGKQVYVSQPNKLSAEEARERRQRLCTLEKRFHQSLVDLKNSGATSSGSNSVTAAAAVAAEGGFSGNAKASPIMVVNSMSAGSLGCAGGVAGNMMNLNLGMNLNMNTNMNMNASGGFDTGGMATAALGTMSNASGALDFSSMGIGNTSGLSIESANFGFQNATSSMAGQQQQQPQQLLEEIAFQENMLRLRAQQQELQQQQQQLSQEHSNKQQQTTDNKQKSQRQSQRLQQELGGVGESGQVNLNSVRGTGTGSYVDPILGNLSFSQNSTPLAASQYWRHQALLEASNQMDSLRMAQVGAIGIQRPILEPGGIRDLRLPNSDSNNSGEGLDERQLRCVSLKEDGNVRPAMKRDNMADRGADGSDVRSDSQQAKRARRMMNDPTTFSGNAFM